MIKDKTITPKETGGRSITLENPATLVGIDTMCRRGLMFFLEQPIHSKRKSSFAVELLIREALTNAVLHGSGCEPSRRVILRLTVDQEGVTIEVSDEGPGFDWRSALARPMVTLYESGRGLTIYRKYADSVSFNETGNIIVLKRKWKKGEEHA